MNVHGTGERARTEWWCVVPHRWVKRENHSKLTLDQVNICVLLYFKAADSAARREEAAGAGNMAGGLGVWRLQPSVGPLVVRSEGERWNSCPAVVAAHFSVTCEFWGCLCSPHSCCWDMGLCEASQQSPTWKRLKLPQLCPSPGLQNFTLHLRMGINTKHSWCWRRVMDPGSLLTHPLISVFILRTAWLCSSHLRPASCFTKKKMYQMRF